MLNFLLELSGPLNTNQVSLCHQNAAVGMYCQSHCEMAKIVLGEKSCFAAIITPQTIDLQTALISLVGALVVLINI